MSSVTQHLEQVYGIRIQPGGKGVCQVCRRDKTFSVKKDDSLGHCFHPSCYKSIAAGRLTTDYKGSLYEVLDRIKEVCHEYLIDQQAKKITGGAWHYLVNKRDVHPRVISDLAELGAVPPNLDVATLFKPSLDVIEARGKELNAKIEDSLKRRLESKEARTEANKQGKQKSAASAKDKTEHELAWENELLRLRSKWQYLQEQCTTLQALLKNAAHWIAFFHTDAHHRVLSIRFRQPFDKKFLSFVLEGNNTGLFGHPLFQPYSESSKQGNRLVVVEGELNVLALQSLAVRMVGPEAEGGSYANWVAATGSACTVDVGAVRALLATPGAMPPPVIIQDNDDAGDKMVERLRESFALALVTPLGRGSDIEDHIRTFKDDYAAAWRSLVTLLREARLLTRPFEAVAKNIFNSRQKQGKGDSRREHEINAEVMSIVLKDINERGKFYHEFQ
jgi:hypothetical protein